MTAEGYVGTLLLLQLVFSKICTLTASCDVLHVLACETSVQHEAARFQQLGHYMPLLGCGSLHQSLYRAHAHARGYQHPRVQSLNPRDGVHYIQ